MTKLAIMQPYFCTYIGYFQLINSVDKFIIGDTLQYTRRGWFNRNKILNNGKEFLFTIPIKNEGNYRNVHQINMATNSHEVVTKMLTRIKYFSGKAPYFSDNYLITRNIFLKDSSNLFEFINFSIREIAIYLNINTQFILASSLDIDPEKRGYERIIEICNHLNADIYINPLGGKMLYNKNMFAKAGIELKFIKSKYIEYLQFNHEFIPWLSIIDILMFNSIDQIRNYLNEYDFE